MTSSWGLDNCYTSQPPHTVRQTLFSVFPPLCLTATAATYNGWFWQWEVKQFHRVAKATIFAVAFGYRIMTVMQ